MDQYSQGNTAQRLYQVTKEISRFQQGRRESVAAYYVKLQVLWDKLSELSEPEAETERLYQFLMGLNSMYDDLISKILNTQPLPSVSEALSAVSEEERMCQVVGTAEGKMKENPPKKEILGLTNKKDVNFDKWFSEVAVKGGMMDYSVLYLWHSAMSIWEVIKEFFDAEIKKMKFEEWYFLVPIRFTPEEREQYSFTLIKKQIRGQRDLPFRRYQWCHVACGESSNFTPSIRFPKFLRQEGHSAFATLEEAEAEVLDILELYRRIYEEFLAIPVIKGKKSEMAKSSGGYLETSVEAFIPNTGQGVQGATSHCLGQKFEITFENEKGENCTVWQNSWAYTSLTIGVMIMVHGDDKGLVLPPRVAPVQVVVVPVPYKDADMQGIFNACNATVDALSKAGIRAETDLRENYSPGWKYSNWEMKGVPLRIEIGPKDFANNQVRAVRRDNSAKTEIPRAELVAKVNQILTDIQWSLFDSAKQKRDACIQVAKTWEDFMAAFEQKKMILAPWCDEEEVERDVKERTADKYKFYRRKFAEAEMDRAKTLCSPPEQPKFPEGFKYFASGMLANVHERPSDKYKFYRRKFAEAEMGGEAVPLCSPLEQPELREGTRCFASGKPAKKWTYWGRRYS